MNMLMLLKRTSHYKKPRVKLIENENYYDYPVINPTEIIISIDRVYRIDQACLTEKQELILSAIYQKLPEWHGSGWFGKSSYDGVWLRFSLDSIGLQIYGEVYYDDFCLWEQQFHSQLEQTFLPFKQ